MSDVFSEVDGQVRSDRLRSAAARGWPIALAIAAVALVVFLAAWGWKTWRENQSQHASDAYAAGLDALAKGDAKTAEARFTEVSKSAPGAYKSLALMQESGIRLTQGKAVEAADLLEQAAAASSAPVIADAARLKAVFLLMDQRPLADIEARLKPLAEPGRPYRWEAVEARALARLQAGRTQAAHADFAVISLAQDVSDASRARARAAMGLIDDGSAAAIPGLVKAGLAAPALPAAVTPVLPTPLSSPPSSSPSQPSTSPDPSSPGGAPPAAPAGAPQ